MGNSNSTFTLIITNYQTKNTEKRLFYDVEISLYMFVHHSPHLLNILYSFWVEISMYLPRLEYIQYFQLTNIIRSQCIIASHTATEKGRITYSLSSHHK